MAPLTVGFLHVGRPESGVRRYGRIIEDGVRGVEGVTVLEADAGMLDEPDSTLVLAGRSLREADVVHIQWNRRGWGRSVQSVRRLFAFRRTTRRPLVATLHDVFERTGFRRRYLEPQVLTLRWLSAQARRLVVHSEEEVRRLEGIVDRRKISVVPHFVEDRELAESPDQARTALGLAGHRIVTLLGFVFGRKGHEILLEAIPLLPDDVVVIFAGGPVAGRGRLAARLVTRARETGVTDRLRITGYLEESEMERVISATTLAVCPFRDLSASGSLSTWIASGKPILATDLPGFREYDAMVPGAIRLFGPRTPERLAEAITEQLATLGNGAVSGAESADGRDDPAVARLRERLTVPVTAERYLAVYREALAAR